MLKMSSFLVILLLLGLIIARPVKAVENIETILSRVEQARTDYDTDRESLHDQLLKTLEKEVAEAQQAGSFDRVTKLGAERSAFIEKGILPKEIGTDGFTNGLTRARERLETALVRARKELTQAGALEHAKAIDSEITQLQSSAPGLKVKRGGKTQRILWMKTNRTQYFIKGVGTDWFEKAENGRRAEIFSERARTDEYIELRHNTAPITIRLGTTSILVRLKDSEAFVEAKDAGTWVQP